MTEWINVIDISIAVVILLFAWGGSQKGFATQVASFLVFVAMAGFMFFAYPRIFNYLGRVFRDMQEAYFTWLIICGLIVAGILLYLLLAKVVSKFLKMQISEPADRINGLILGFSRGVFFILVVMILMVMLGPPSMRDTLPEQSRVAKMVCEDMLPRIQPHVNRAVISEKVESVRNRLMQREDPLPEEI